MSGGAQGTVLAVLLSLVSAAGYALAAVAQSRLASASAGGALRALLARGQWWWAVGLNAAGALAHVAALHYGPLTLVQPLGALTLVAALPLGAYCARRRVTRTEWRGALWTLAGLVALISVTGPATPGDALTLREALIVAAATALLIATLTSGPRVAGVRGYARRRDGAGARGAEAMAGGPAKAGAKARTGGQPQTDAAPRIVATAQGGATTQPGPAALGGPAAQASAAAQPRPAARGNTGSHNGPAAPGGSAHVQPTAPADSAHAPRRGWGLGFATASGVASGVGSALTQTLTAALARELPGGVPVWWQTALVAVLIAAFAVGGLLLSQTAYQGGLAAPLAVVNLSNPAAAAVIGVALLGETFRAGVWGWLVAAAASVVAARGVVLLTTGTRTAPVTPSPSPVVASGQPVPSPRTDEEPPATTHAPAPIAG